MSIANLNYKDILNRVDGYEEYLEEIENINEKKVWEKVLKINTKQAYLKYIEYYPTSIYAEIAEIKAREFIEIDKKDKENKEFEKQKGIFLQHKQYVDEYKKDLLEKIEHKNILEQTRILEEKNLLSIKDINKNEYSYDELVKHFINLKDKYTYKDFKVYDRNYYDFSSLIGLKYYIPCNKHLSKANIRIYERRLVYASIRGLNYATYEFYYDFRYIEKHINIRSNCDKKLIINLVKEKFYNYQFSFRKNGIAKFTKNGKYGLIDKNNKVLTSQYFDYINDEYFDEKDICYFTNGDEMGILDDKGNILLQCECDRIYMHDYDFKEKEYLIKVRKNKKFGLYDAKSQKFILNIEYDYISSVNYLGIVKVRKGLKKGTLDKEGNWIKKLSFFGL